MDLMNSLYFLPTALLVFGIVGVSYALPIWIVMGVRTYFVLKQKRSFAQLAADGVPLPTVEATRKRQISVRVIGIILGGIGLLTVLSFYWVTYFISTMLHGAGSGVAMMVVSGISLGGGYLGFACMWEELLQRGLVKTLRTLSAPEA